MTTLLIPIITALLTGIAAYAIAMLQTRKREHVLALKTLELQTNLKSRDEAIATLHQDIDALEQDVAQLQKRYETALSDKTESATRLQTTLEKISQLEQENAQHRNAREEAIQAKFEAEKQVERMQQEVSSIRIQMEDWEKTKAESLKTAKEAMFSTGGELFRKEAEEMDKKTKEGFQEIMKNVASLQDRLNKSESSVETLWRSLSSPGAAGNFAEFGLENTFKNYGLEPGRDFVMQYSIAGDSNTKLRPDAVVFLPGGNVLVVDSKASKFFLELAEEEGTDKEQETLEGLKRTMHEHIKSLASKNYREAIREYHKYAEHKEDIRHIISVMFIQTDTMLEKICKSDPTLRARAEKEEIILSGPTGLAGIMSFAKYELSREQQLKNQEQIISEISNLLSSIEVVFGYANKLGKGLETAANSYSKFAKSLNHNLLSKARKIAKLGVPLANNKTLPSNLPACQVTMENQLTIEGEAAEIEEEKQLLPAE